MKNALNEMAAREQSLVRLYMELTGASETEARSVFMSVCCGEGQERPRGLDHEHRAGRVADNFLGGAADTSLRGVTSLMRPHHDQVGVHLSRGFQYLRVGNPGAHHGAAP